METEYSIDDIFEGLLHFFRKQDLSSQLKKDAFNRRAKSEKAEHAYGLYVKPFVVTDQNTATSLYYREFPLPW